MTLHIKAMEFLGAFFRVDLAGDAIDGVTLRADLAVDLVRRLNLAEGQSLPAVLPRRRLRVYPGSDAASRLIAGLGENGPWRPTRKRPFTGATPPLG